MGRAMDALWPAPRGWPVGGRRVQFVFWGGRRRWWGGLRHPSWERRIRQARPKCGLSGAVDTTAVGHVFAHVDAGPDAVGAQVAVQTLVLELSVRHGETVTRFDTVLHEALGLDPLPDRRDDRLHLAVVACVEVSELADCVVAAMPAELTKVGPVVDSDVVERDEQLIVDCLPEPKLGRVGLSLIHISEPTRPY